MKLRSSMGVIKSGIEEVATATRSGDILVAVPYNAKRPISSVRLSESARFSNWTLRVMDTATGMSPLLGLRLYSTFNHTLQESAP